MAADGSIIIDTAIDTKGFKQGTKSLEAAGKKTANIAKKIGTALGAAFAVHKIVQFGKEALALGSDLQEVQNVVDVTFTTMNEAVNEFAQNAAQTAGLSETMAKRYTGTFGAMAKSFKFTEAEAYEMSTALTQLAGDVASFYNISQDEAYTKLKSVFTGETETLKDLGVVMTQTALDSFALSKGLGKTTSQMTEQEKVALRYQFVMEQLNSASGDFIRTSGSWANQTRILSLQFESLKASLGQGFINILTPVLQVINALVARLTTLANVFRTVTGALFGNQVASSSSQIGEVADGYNEAAAAAENLADNTQKAAKATKSYLSGIDEINKFESNEAAAGGTASGTGLAIGSIAGETVTVDAEVEDALSPKIQGIVDKIMMLITPLKSINFTPLITAFQGLYQVIQPFTQDIFAGLEWFWHNILVPLAAWTIEDILPAFLNVLSDVMSVLSTVLATLQPLATWLWDYFLQPLAEFAITDVLPVFLGILSDAMTKLNEVIIALQPFIAWLWDTFLQPLASLVIEDVLPAFLDILSGALSTLNEVLEAIEPFIVWMWDTFLQPLAEWTGGVIVDVLSDLADVLGWIGDALDRVSNWISEHKGAVETFAIVVGSLAAAWFLVNGAVGLATTAVGLATTAVGLWNSIGAIASAVTTGFGAAVNFLTSPITLATLAVGALIAIGISLWKNWDQVSAWLTHTWESIKSGAISIFTSLMNAIKVPINGIIGFINSLIRGIVNGINSAIRALNRLSFSVPYWVPGIGGAYFGFNIREISAPQIPYLATGAVIPPNAPFTAVLGDQKYGNNLEAPEALLRQIVREESGRGGGDVRVIAQINRRVLFDEMISEAKLRQSTTGQNPFLLT